MEIDEDKILFSDSDHCLVSVKFKFKSAEKINFNKEKWKYVEYYKKDEEAMGRLRREIENEWREGNIEDKQMEEQSIMDKANEILKRKARRRVGTQDCVENVWMNDQIRDGIKKRRAINRRRRNATNEEVKERLWREYQRQKQIVQRMIREAREKHEIELTKEIRRKMKEGRGGKSFGNVWTNF